MVRQLSARKKQPLPDPFASTPPVNSNYPTPSLWEEGGQGREPQILAPRGPPTDSQASGLTAALLECRSTGPFAWFGGEPGQVGNEAAIVV